MAKTKVIGKVLKDSRDPSKSFIVFDDDVSFIKGQFLTLQSKKDELEKVNWLETNGKLKSDKAEEWRNDINNSSDKVRFKIIQSTKE